MRLRATEAHPGRSGAALLLAVLILIVLAAIVFQIFVATSGAARIARNDLAMSAQELAIESALLEEYDKLKTDGEAGDGASSGGGGADPSAGAGGGAAPGGSSPGGGAAQSQACDSQRDEWYQPARTEINEVRLRVFAQDEESKVNVLTMLVADPKLAKEAFERVVRVLDKCRDGTTADIDSRMAEDLTKAMLEYMTKGKKSELPRANQISDDPANQDLKLPRSLREFQILKPFEPSLFRDFRDDHGRMVNSIESFLTVWSALETAGDKPQPPNASSSASKTGTGSAGNTGGTGTAGTGNNSKTGTGAQTPATDEGGAPVGTFGGGSTPGGSSSGNGASPGAGGSGGGTGNSNGSGGSGSGGGSLDTGGWQINVNTAPPAVLKSLFDDRDVNPRFWDKVIEYRNLEEEKDKNKDTSAEADKPTDPVFDEYGREVIQRRIFENLQELEEVEGWKDFSAEVQARIKSMLTVQSRVFSVFVIARRATAVEDATALGGDPQAMRLAEERGDSLMRVVRSVVWRHKVNDEMHITPLIRWELLDSTPHEVLDYPEDVR